MTAVVASSSAVLLLANDRYKWFYWVGPLLVITMVLILGALALGYYVKVLRPKYRGR
jgi:hypothetical protein